MMRLTWLWQKPWILSLLPGIVVCTMPSFNSYHGFSGLAMTVFLLTDQITLHGASSDLNYDQLSRSSRQKYTRSRFVDGSACLILRPCAIKL
jgi:hypothetical protein